MNEKRKNRMSFWKMAVIVLVFAVCAYAVATCYALNIGKSDDKSRDNVQLTTGHANPYKYQQSPSPVQETQQLAPRPIPNLNVNINKVPGLKPSVTLQRQQQSPGNQLIHSIMNTNTSQGSFRNNMREEMAKMEQMMNSMLSNHGGMKGSGMGMLSGGGMSPAISVDKDNNYVVTLNIPDLDTSEINAQINGNMLTVAGVQREEYNTSVSGGSSYVSSYSSFENSFSLPGPAKAEGMKIYYKDNTLTVKIPQA